ncbi:TetR/AcrR family transcriptional regulator [Companilactobacillus jidongensis]|uniref:TetR/AcrR family transcriptional regulator n=1 Tax=Companilactobacillus jidongensis TaxID=2486006 RepID=UPI000F7AF5DE|nr:TetR/AcrR family transcriptional regulator [Companilactobacillus jidongensis]
MAATKHAQNIKQDSREYLLTALLQLLETKNLNDISVSQVVKRAGVSRMAFYRNFDTLDDLLISYFEPVIQARFEEVKNKISEADKLNKIGEFFTDYSDILKLSEKRGFEYIIKKIFDDNMIDFYRTVSLPDQLTEVERRYWTKFMSAGVYAIWYEWLVDGQKETLEKVHILIGGFQNSTMQFLMNK